MNVHKKPKLLFFIGEDSTFYTHRFNLAKAALQAGYQVAIATRCHHYQTIIENAGIQVFPLRRFTRGGLNLWQQIATIRELNQIYADYQPDIVHHVAIKPIILGSMIAKFHKTPKIINALGGLGYIFIDGNETQFLKKIKKIGLKRVAIFLFRWIFSQPNTELILQNSDDRQTLISARCIQENQITLIRGAGVDINAFPALPTPTQQTPIIITCVSRLLWDKGIQELVDAAKILKANGIPAKVILYGEPDPQNPRTIPLETIQAWHAAHIIEWRGHSENVAKVYAECHIAVLPSYREGLPKSLLEAASSARPIVTTDTAGCREVVEDQVNGILVPVKNTTALAEALTRLCQDPASREKMGLAGRARVEKYFSDSLVHQQTLALYTKT